MKLQDANLQVYENSSFTNPSSCILPSFSKNASRYCFRRDLQSRRPKFLPENISKK